MSLAERIAARTHGSCRHTVEVEVARQHGPDGKVLVRCEACGRTRTVGRAEVPPEWVRRALAGALPPKVLVG